MWIRNLAEPIFEDYDYVSPLYIRHKYDVTVTNSIAYPLTRALYGRRVRQPIGGDVAFSGAVTFSFVESNIWNDAIAHFGIDAWMTTNAVKTHGSIIQSFMGRPKVHKTRKIDSQVDLIFEDVVGTIFELMLHFDSFWKDVGGADPQRFSVLDLVILKCHRQLIEKHKHYGTNSFRVFAENGIFILLRWSKGILINLKRLWTFRPWDLNSRPVMGQTCL